MSPCLWWLGILQFLILVKRLQILGFLPFPGQVLSLYHLQRQLLSVLMILETLTPVLKDPERETAVLFSAWRGFLPECHPYQDSGDMKKGTVYMACWCWEGVHHHQLPSWPPCLLWAIPSSLHGARGRAMRVTTSEEVLLRLQPPPTFAHPQKYPKLLQTNIFISSFWISETWSFDALFILKSNLTPSHTAQMFLHFSYFDFLLTWMMNDGNEGQRRGHCRQPCLQRFMTCGFPQIFTQGFSATSRPWWSCIWTWEMGEPANSGSLCQLAYADTSQRRMKSQSKNQPKINGIWRPWNRLI